SFGRKAALHIPGFGERGSLCEMLGQAAAQVLVVDPAPVLTPVLLGVLIGLLAHTVGSLWGGVILAASIALYVATVLWMLFTRRRESMGPSSRVFHHTTSLDLDPLPQVAWTLGLPEPYVQPVQAEPVPAPNGSRVFTPVNRV
ncbi:MAG TPA: hypothetical protein VF719_09050, partial [Abditibacteriaceae bacterium]